MAEIPLFASAAHRWSRARRWLLLGNAGPFLARYAPSDLPTPDSAEGSAAIRVWARWRVADLLDESLGSLTSVRTQRGGDAFGVPGALALLAEEPDREAAAELVRALARSARPMALDLGSALARAVDLAAQRGAPGLVEASEVPTARSFLDATEEPVRDVLTWATLRAGRSRRSPTTLADVLRVLRNESLDAQFRPVSNPWPALIAWREGLGLGFTAVTEIGAALEAWPGSWALRGKRSRLVGASGWLGAQRARFALQGLGRLDVLAEGGHAALLPRDPAAAQILEAAIPMLLCEPGFVGRVFGSGAGASLEKPSADLARQLALAELLLQRLQAAAVLLWSAFESAREVGAVLDAASEVSRALYAKVPAELAILIAAPWSDGISALPSASLAAAFAIADWRERFDEDFWRNPRFAEPLRALASRAASETLEELLPDSSKHSPGAHALWTEASLGR